jgi:two-component system, response regulator
MNPEALRRVLFVEDDDDHAELILRGLEAQGAEADVVRVCDGEAALAHLQKCTLAEDGGAPILPDVILLDLRLPKVDGLQVLREIKGSEALRRIPVIVLTTSDAESDIGRAYDFQVNAYVVKPVDFHKLGALLSDIGKFWLTWNRLPPLGRAAAEEPTPARES